MKNKWKSNFELYNQLKNDFLNLNANKNSCKKILRQALNLNYSKKQITDVIKTASSNLSILDQWDRIDFLRIQLEDINSIGRLEDEPAESVFQVAIAIDLLGITDELTADKKQRYFFRGQRNHKWTTTPSMFRFADTNKKEELSTSLEHLRKICGHLKEKNIGTSEFETLAIAQHYSHELRVKTWLLDFTLNPLVALYFASSNAKNEEIGTLDYWNVNEWKNFSSGKNSLIGKLRYCQPEGIPRIKNQEAFFVELPLPTLYEKLEPIRYYFKQHPEEPFQTNSINKDFIYPQNDPLLKLIKTIDFDSNIEITSEIGNETRLTRAFLQEPNSDIYMEIVEPWLKGYNESQINECRKFCKLFALINDSEMEFPISITTLHFLKNGVQDIGYITESENRNVIDIFKDKLSPDYKLKFDDFVKNTDIIV